MALKISIAGSLWRANAEVLRSVDMANHHMRALLLGVLVALGPTACTEGSPATGDSVSRDSAGIRIIESVQSLLPESSWEIGGIPILSIGRADGDSTQELYRVMGALRLAPDTLLIVNGGTAEVRWYDGQGQLIRSAGRQGAAASCPTSATASFRRAHSTAPTRASTRPQRPIV